MNSRFSAVYYRTLMQSFQYQGAGAPSQKSVGYWAAPNSRGHQGSSTGGNSLANYFVPAGAPSAAGNGSMRGGTFPRRSGFPKRAPVKKPFDPTGKTPAMILHELYK